MARKGKKGLRFSGGPQSHELSFLADLLFVNLRFMVRPCQQNPSLIRSIAN